MNENDFTKAKEEDRAEFVTRPYQKIPLTELVIGSDSHLIFGENILISFLTMKAGSIFELHSHPEEQIMFVVEGYCDEIIEDKIYRVSEGDVIHLPSNVPHGAFIRDVDCKAIDVFSPVRKDYFKKFKNQHPDFDPRFRDLK